MSDPANETHSPTPWRVLPRTYRGGVYIQDESNMGGDYVIAEFYGPAVEPDARFACLAANNHAALVATLAPFGGLLQEHNEHHDPSMPVFEINGHSITIGHLHTARALLAKIESESTATTAGE